MKGQNGVCDRSMCWPLVRTGIESVDVGVLVTSTGRLGTRLQSTGLYVALEKNAVTNLSPFIPVLLKDQQFNSCTIL